MCIIVTNYKHCWHTDLRDYIDKIMPNLSDIQQEKIARALQNDPKGFKIKMKNYFKKIHLSQNELDEIEKEKYEFENDELEKLEKQVYWKQRGYLH